MSSAQGTHFFPAESSANEARALELLALTRIKGLGDAGVARVLARARSQSRGLADFFEAPLLRLREHYGLAAPAAAFVRQHAQQLREQGAQLLERARALGIVLLSPGDSGYPSQLEAFYDGEPPLLYARGNFTLLATRAVALLNSADPPPEALDYSFTLARRLAEAGRTLLTGTEGAAHNLVGLAGKQSGGNLIVVLHRGLFETFDSRPQREPLPLARRLDETLDLDRMLLLSPFRLDGRWQKGNGPRRDALIVALAETLVAVHLHAGGTMEPLCRQALELGRRIFACQAIEPTGKTSALRRLLDAGAGPLVPDVAGANVDLVLAPPQLATAPAAGDLERRRALGQFFTPPEVAAFIWDMVDLMRGGPLSKTARVIDPACGEGVFLHVARERGLSAAQLWGTDIDETLLPAWRQAPQLQDARLFRTNGLLDNPAIDLLPGSFDLVIGNPPFSGKGFKDLLRLIERPKITAGELDLFNSAASPGSNGQPLPRHERALLDHLVRGLSQYQCWRFHDEPEDEEESPAGNGTGGGGLFAGLDLPAERSLQGADYDRLAHLIREWPAKDLLDISQAGVRDTIRRLASTAIEVFFTERFVQLTKPGGMVAVIVPESILASDQVKPLRQWFLENTQLLAVVSLPQKVFTGVGANAKTGILFARRLTEAEERATAESEPYVDGCRLLLQLRKANVVLVSPDPNWRHWDLGGYLDSVLDHAREAAKGGIWRGGEP